MADTKIDTRIPCGNEDHEERTPAVARLSWPDGRFRPTTACREDLEDTFLEAIDERLTLLIEPIKPEGERKGSKDYTEAIREVERAYRNSYSEPVRAILLEAQDMPGYDMLPDTLEERQQLPARFHVPRWDGVGEPNLWLCAVCWDEGTVTQWPCKAASEHGGEVFAR
ncbi:hypothetical protein [Nonomuraea basaltis]|uniref:hypothetical protein n=1 Tax=Nonomuraea basaltis TaxID=2495887 RepID=UPI00110C5139|nr:hypothetical protein [Nonomuraea basaltis]TMS00136.1 hypothetical protein EJK15_03430 [Nonomuraea basaltis]